MFKSTSSSPCPSEEFFRLRRSMPPSLQDTPSVLEFVMLLIKLTWSLAHGIVNSWTEQNIPTLPQRASESTYIHVEFVSNSRNFKLKKQVDLTTVLTKELDSTMDEVEFWQEKYEEAMKTIQKPKRYCLQDLETLFEEEIEESLHLHHLIRRLPVHLQSTSFPHNDDD
jgi:hypothetical protein